mmetsp:Transcript_24759/g.21953  ORF Transcript_24759/g.21953 Transcript_24759/m.21953 type:complete len:193 (-) Transcript_24759:79-657(-)
MESMMKEFEPAAPKKPAKTQKKNSDNISETSSTQGPKPVKRPQTAKPIHKIPKEAAPSKPKLVMVRQKPQILRQQEEGHSDDIVEALEEALNFFDKDFHRGFSRRYHREPEYGFPGFLNVSRPQCHQRVCRNPYEFVEPRRQYYARPSTGYYRRSSPFEELEDMMMNFGNPFVRSHPFGLNDSRRKSVIFTF